MAVSGMGSWSERLGKFGEGGHALSPHLPGTVILAGTANLIAGLSSSNCVGSSRDATLRK